MKFEILDGFRWMVTKTKPRCEKKFAEYCEKRHISTYLPLRRSIKRYAKRVVEFKVPVFQGYVFTHTRLEERVILQESRHSAQVIVPDTTMEETLVQELSALEILIGAVDEGKVQVRPEVQTGNRVQIKRGVLAGLTGMVARRSQMARVTVNVEMIGYSVSVDLDVDTLEIDV